jgi:hypothetical protein
MAQPEQFENDLGNPWLSFDPVVAPAAPLVRLTTNSSLLRMNIVECLMRCWAKSPGTRQSTGNLE